MNVVFRVCPLSSHIRIKRTLLLNKDLHVSWFCGHRRRPLAVGHLTIKNFKKRDKYRRQVPTIPAPWGTELIFRGNQVEVLAGENLQSSIVVVRSPNIDELNGWYSSPTYQAFIPPQLRAAKKALFPYEEQGSQVISDNYCEATWRYRELFFSGFRCNRW
jgi:uncharacterized protein (DUF1330 family)